MVQKRGNRSVKEWWTSGCRVSPSVSSTFKIPLVRYSPCCSHHRQGDGEANAQTGPHKRRSLCQEPAGQENSRCKLCYEMCAKSKTLMDHVFSSVYVFQVVKRFYGFLQFCKCVLIVTRGRIKYEELKPLSPSWNDDLFKCYTKSCLKSAHNVFTPRLLTMLRQSGIQGQIWCSRYLWQ